MQSPFVEVCRPSGAFAYLLVDQWLAPQRIRDRRAVVPRSALEVPQVLSRGGVVSGTESLGVAGKDQASAGGQDARTPRRARLDVPLDGAGRRVNRLERPRCLAVNQRERAPPIRLSLDEERLSRSELGAIIDDRYIRVTRAGVIRHWIPFFAAGRTGTDTDPF